MRRLGAFIAVAAMVLLTVGLSAQNPDAIVGKWLNQPKDAHIEIFKAPDGKYFGKIAWLKEPTYPGDDKKGMAGKEKVDRENPDPAKRTKPILGLVILRDFVYSDSIWQSGRIYDPENGKDYKCKMTLKSPDALDVRGFIGFSLIGRTENWTRVKAGTQ